MIRRVGADEGHGAHARRLVLAHVPRELRGGRPALRVGRVAVAVKVVAILLAGRLVVAALQRVGRVLIAVLYLDLTFVSYVPLPAGAVISPLMRLQVQVIVLRVERGDARRALGVIFAVQRWNLRTLVVVIIYKLGLAFVSVAVAIIHVYMSVGGLQVGAVRDIDIDRMAGHGDSSEAST